ncbi:MAG: NADH-quinone oxidoreductase subunit L [Chloroflexi bacterium]|nr:NADH-quinone oxidoreductase subunit L [Chloroflexota bacterium]
MLNYPWLVLLFPLVGVIINAFVGRHLGKRGAGILASAMVGLSFVGAAWMFVELLGLEDRVVTRPLFDWISVGDFNVQVKLLIDPLSSVMAVVVSGVSFLIHIYSIGYMAHDERFVRFFAYLNLFVFAMLTLVLAENLLVTYVGWEGVGLCSYLLIGFWFERKSAADAGKKAFLVNRVGDVGFALGLMLMFVTFGSLSMSQVLENIMVVRLMPGVATAISLLLFVGAVGKSAQIPLYVWLPDAMEGPTPVSALIHAATMVTAGVYMVARTHTLFALSPSALTWVAAIGGVTAFFAATIALTQHDLKRVLAYSTISQLGYMFLGVGVGAYAAGIFHLTTHAFFKALLFLGAGSVMHALAGELDIRKMGGLRSKIPITFWTFLIAALAIAGFPGLAGFFSKDEILWQTFAGGKTFLWALALLTAGLTAFYVFRLVFMVFYGESRVDKKVAAHVHESPRVMTVPMAILAVFSVIAGYIGVPKILGGSNWIEHYLDGSLGWHSPDAAIAETAHASAGTEWALLILSVIVALAGIALAYVFYVRRTDLPARVAKSLGGLYTLVYNKYKVDEFYTAVVVNPLRSLGQFLAARVDGPVVDGIVEGIAALVALVGRGLQALQTGLARNYALAILAGAALLLVYALVR